VIVCLLYLLGKLPLVETNLVITPGFIIPAYMKVWTFVTAPLYENQWYLVPCSVAVLFASGIVLEPLWGTKEFLVFQAVAGCGGGLVTTALYLLIYMITSSESVLFATIHGLWPLLGGNLVALKQMKPDLTVVSIPQIRAKFWLPCTLLVAVLLPLTGFVSWSAPVLVFMGALCGWIYLRFYQPRTDGRRGDLGDNFAFATFFPEMLQKPVSHLSEVLYSVFVKVKICPKWVRSYDISSSSAVTIKLPGVDSVDAERRKQKALKALNERLSKVESPTSAKWPSMDDGEPSEQFDLEPTSPTDGGKQDKSDSVAVTIEGEGSRSDIQTI
jgi:membrane associated rhomboid family serine protease